MTNPVLQAFFVGRALAEGLNEQVEAVLSNALSDLGKFDAEQREKLRTFSEQVLNRAAQASSERGGSTSPGGMPSSGDLQETIDDLRAEVALLRSKLQEYRNQHR